MSCKQGGNPENSKEAQRVSSILSQCYQFTNVVTSYGGKFLKKLLNFAKAEQTARLTPSDASARKARCKEGFKLKPLDHQFSFFRDQVSFFFILDRNTRLQKKKTFKFINPHARPVISFARARARASEKSLLRRLSDIILICTHNKHTAGEVGSKLIGAIG